MAFNGSGSFARLYNWVSDRNAAIKIRADRMDAEMDGFADGLSNCITRDGQTTITQDIPFNNKRITALGAPTDGGDALSLGEAQSRFNPRVLRTITSASSAGDRTLTASDSGGVIVLSGTADFTVTIDPVANLFNGWNVEIKDACSGTVTLDPNASETIDGATTATMTFTQLGHLICDGTNFILIRSQGPHIGQHLRGSFTSLPALCLWANGQNVSRTTYAALLAATTIAGTVSITNTSTSAQITVANDELGRLLQAGLPIEATGIQAGTTITAATFASGTTYNITLSLAATATAGANSARLFPNGNGNGSTTFGVADIRDRASVGRSNMGGSAAGRITSVVTGLNSSKLGAGGGDQNLQAHTHEITGSTNNINNTAGAHFYNTNQFNTAGATGNTGTGTAGNLPPSIIENVVVFAGA